MKKKHIIEILKKARKNGCSCILLGSATLCGACLASNILNKKIPSRRQGFVSEVTVQVLDRVKKTQLEAAQLEAASLEAVEVEEREEEQQEELT